MKKIIIKTPQLGVNDHNATIVEWFINDGDEVNKGDLLCTIETTKTTLDIEAESEGIVKILKECNSLVSINQPICIIYPSKDEFNKFPSADYLLFNNNSSSEITITKKAQKLIDQNRIDIYKYFHNGIIKEKDVLEIIESQGNKTREINLIPNKTNIFIYGASQGGFTVVEGFKSEDSIINGFIDDNIDKLGKEFYSYTVFSPSQLESIEDKVNISLFIAIANSKTREAKFQWAKKNSIRVITVINSNSYISPTAKIGKGCHIKAGAVIDSNSIIGEGCIIDNNVSIAHDNKIDSFCHVAPGASLGSNIKVGRYSIIGIGASVSTGITIEENCIISVGSAINEDIKENSVVEGNPAKIIGKKK